MKRRLGLMSQRLRWTNGSPAPPAQAQVRSAWVTARWLKDTAVLLRTCQESVRIAYRTDLIG